MSQTWTPPSASTEVLGCRLTSRFGNAWATVQAGESLTIGLHPASPEYPAPGTLGAVVRGLEIDLPIVDAVARLIDHGAKMKGEIKHGNAGSFATFADPDGNEFYLWQVNRAMAPGPESLKRAQGTPHSVPRGSEAVGDSRLACFLASASLMACCAIFISRVMRAIESTFSGHDFARR